MDRSVRSVTPSVPCLIAPHVLMPFKNRGLNFMAVDITLFSLRFQIRESFMRQFVSQEIDEPLIIAETVPATPVRQPRMGKIDMISTQMEFKTQPTPDEIQADIQALIRDAYKKRNMLNDAELLSRQGGLLRDRAR